MKKVLFVCSQNRLRSPTAEQVFSSYEGLQVSPAGTNHDADHPVTRELIRWADLIFVMERRHRTRIQQQFRAVLNGKKLICLEIPDDYGYMDPALIRLLQAKVPRFLPAGVPHARADGRPGVPVDRSSTSVTAPSKR